MLGPTLQALKQRGQLSWWNSGWNLHNLGLGRRFGRKERLAFYFTFKTHRATRTVTSDWPHWEDAIQLSSRRCPAQPNKNAGHRNVDLDLYQMGDELLFITPAHVCEENISEYGGLRAGMCVVSHVPR